MVRTVPLQGTGEGSIPFWYIRGDYQKWQMRSKPEIENKLKELRLEGQEIREKKNDFTLKIDEYAEMKTRYKQIKTAVDTLLWVLERREEI